MKVKSKKANILLLFFFLSFLINQSRTDSLSLYLDQSCIIKEAYRQEIIFHLIYEESYYRAIHTNYITYTSSSVKLITNEGSGGGIGVTCGEDPKDREIIKGGNNELYSFNYKCYIPDSSSIVVGSYYVNIYGKIKDLSDYSNPSSKIKFVSYNFNPTLKIISFSQSKEDCVSSGNSITLLAQMDNVYNYNVYGSNGIGLYVENTSSKEIDPLYCNFNEGSNGNFEVSCDIPSYLSYGKYKVYYSTSNGPSCDNVLIKEFDSTKFSSGPKYFNVANSLPKITMNPAEILSDENSYTDGSFLLNFKESYSQAMYGVPTINSFSNKDIGIYIEDCSLNELISTTCSLKDNKIENNNIKISILCKPSKLSSGKFEVAIYSEINIGKTEKNGCPSQTGKSNSPIILSEWRSSYYINIDSSTSSFNIECGTDQYLTKNKDNEYVCYDYSSDYTDDDNDDPYSDRFDKKHTKDDILDVKESSYYCLKHSFQILEFTFSVEENESLNFKKEDISSFMTLNKNGFYFYCDCKISFSSTNKDICPKKKCLVTGTVDCSFPDSLNEGEYKKSFTSYSEIGNALNDYIEMGLMNDYVEVKYCNNNNSYRIKFSVLLALIILFIIFG